MADEPSDAQLTPDQRQAIDEAFAQDRRADELEDQRTDAQPAGDDPAAAESA